MKPVMGVLLALALGLNGAAMLIAPAWWYAAVPGVRGTGPLNTHFVKDVGAAYVVCCVAFLAVAVNAKGWGRGAAVAAALFLGLHAAIHLVEAFASLDPLADMARDFTGVTAPALLALWIAAPWPRFPETRNA
jgi:L-cystine uptake protein TcyP (sodium:dicarboxylate symporter family)